MFNTFGTTISLFSVEPKLGYLELNDRLCSGCQQAAALGRGGVNSCLSSTVFYDTVHMCNTFVCDKLLGSVEEFSFCRNDCRLPAVQIPLTFMNY